MYAETLKQAINEANRFVKLANKVPIGEFPNIKYIPGYCKESAACKRASMDLTRILADLRQNR